MKKMLYTYLFLLSSMIYSLEAMEEVKTSVPSLRSLCLEKTTTFILENNEKFLSCANIKYAPSFTISNQENEPILPDDLNNLLEQAIQFKLKDEENKKIKFIEQLRIEQLSNKKLKKRSATSNADINTCIKNLSSLSTLIKKEIKEYSTDEDKIDLFNKKLSTVPEEIYQDNVSINLSINSLSTMPQPKMPYNQLKHLDLSWNCFNRFPIAITSLVSLEDLNLSHNNIKTIPQRIYQLQSLKFFDIRKNNLESLPIDIMDHLKKIIIFDLTNNKNLIIPQKILSSHFFREKAFIKNTLTRTLEEAFESIERLEKKEQD